jgi:aspartate aminotransferase
MRAMYSNPPAHGARIFVKIFSSPVHRETWNAELKELGARMIKMRYMLRDELVKLGTPGNWDHIVK